MKTELRTQLATANVALTTDCWTSLTTESYITVTCHYIEPDWQLVINNGFATTLAESFKLLADTCNTSIIVIQQTKHSQLNRNKCSYRLINSSNLVKPEGIQSVKCLTA
uniref:Uncharacterized protein n=1 Tax=Iconisemion striatum TaxID=60296 RepID=A0A1A7WZH3_9TELE